MGQSAVLFETKPAGKAQHFIGSPNGVLFSVTPWMAERTDRPKSDALSLSLSLSI